MEKDVKISLEKVKALPFKTLNRLISKLREFLKKDEVVQRAFKEYNVDISEIDFIPMMFGDIDVSYGTH
jgi:hypothetical protein